MLALAAAPRLVSAQTDEIQVYDGGLAPPGTFNLTLHNNFTPSGVTTPAFPGALVADKSLNGVPEWAYGVTPWFEAGLYLPLYSIGKTNGQSSAMLNGFKLRLLFAVPHADDRTFFYGVNFEFSVNAKYWESKRITSEVRPIVGAHLNRWDLILNPILDTDYTGGLGNLEFAPATRVAYNINKTWALAAEEYANLGPLRHFRSLHDQFHEVWAVTDYTGKFVNVEAGFGIGLTGGADRLTLKLMVSFDLNRTD